MAKRPSSWVNLQDYLGLNQEAGQEMGQRLVGDVGADAQQAGSDIRSAQRKFGQQSRDGTLHGPLDLSGTNLSYSVEDAQRLAGGGYQGPESLGEVNGDLYGQVKDAVSRVKNAQDSSMRGGELAKVYGGQAGSGPGGSGLDSFLTGQTSAAELSGLGDAWGGLQSTLDIADQGAMKQADAATDASNAAAKQWSEAGPADPKAGEAGQWRPKGYGSYHEFMDKGGMGQAHEAAMYASPADWATRAAGELGYDGENVSQIFSKMFGANGNQQGGTGDWSTGNLRSAARLVQDQYGDKPVQAWFDSLTPEAWQEMMNTGNAGGQARKMRKWLSENGYNKIRG